MKKIAKGFTKASKIIGIVGIVCAAIASVIFTIVGIANIVMAAGKSGSEAEGFAAAAAGAFTGMVMMFVCLVICILGTISSGKLYKKLDTATGKGETIALSVLVLIFGFLPAGIISLCVPAAEFEAPKADAE
ncbi:MAG: hypothetical protein MJ239_06100 [Bacilli bacterium]|nr:hypothetical protein [Bacilli bacterium]